MSHGMLHPANVLGCGGSAECVPFCSTLVHCQFGRAVGGIRLRNNGCLPIQGVSRFVRAKRTTWRADLQFSIGFGGLGSKNLKRLL